METLNKKTEAENNEAVAEKAPEKKWVLVERGAAEEIIADQDRACPKKTKE